jgi:hypothetical protein
MVLATEAARRAALPHTSEKSVGTRKILLMFGSIIYQGLVIFHKYRNIISEFF